MEPGPVSLAQGWPGADSGDGPPQAGALGRPSAQKHRRPHRETCQKSETSGLPPDPWNQKFWGGGQESVLSGPFVDQNLGTRALRKRAWPVLSAVIIIIIIVFFLLL